MPDHQKYEFVVDSFELLGNHQGAQTLMGERSADGWELLSNHVVAELREYRAVPTPTLILVWRKPTGHWATAAARP